MGVTPLVEGDDTRSEDCSEDEDALFLAFKLDAATAGLCGILCGICAATCRGVEKGVVACVVAAKLGLGGIPTMHQSARNSEREGS